MVGQQTEEMFLRSTYHFGIFEMNYQYLIILKGEKVIIPQRMQFEMIHYIHASHIRVEKYKHLARYVLFWPGR